MAGRFNMKCAECANIPDIRKLEPKPECYDIRICARRRSYYRDHEAKKIQMRVRFFRYANMAKECALCHVKERLEVHHIEPRKGREDRDEVSNMITLCHDCHVTVEKYITKTRMFYALQESIAIGVGIRTR